LQLANEQKWVFVSTEETEAWVDRLTATMELKSCEQNESPSLIFVRGNLTESKVQDIARLLNVNMGLTNLQAKWKRRKLNFLRFWYNHEVSDVVCELSSNYHYRAITHKLIDVWRMWHVLYPVYERVQNSGGLPIHAALVERCNVGVLISAPGGTGKTTCCRRIQPHWKALCDDESLIVPNNQGQYMVHPFPTWSSLFDQTSVCWNVQQYFPLRAIFFLEQSENDEVVPIGQGQSAALISDAVSWIWSRGWKSMNKQEEIELKKKIFDNSCQLARTIPAFKLRASLNGGFWEKMEKAIESI